MFSADLGVNQVASNPPATNPPFNKVALLLHGDGTNGAQNNTFLDSSTNNFTITRTGNVAQGTFSPFSLAEGQWSNYFDGTGDYLTVAQSTALDLTADFTIEFWTYFNAIGSEITFIAKTGSGSQYGWFVQLVSGNLRVNIGNNGSLGTSKTFAWTPSVGIWYHVAVTRSGSNLKAFINGNQIGTTATETNNGTSTASVGIGINLDGTYQAINGYLSNVRVVKGTAVYTSAFTPPTAPLTAITNTSLLLNFTNAGIIDSTGKNVLETVADAQIDTTTKKYGTGAMEFDGSGDWLLMPNTPDQQLGTGNFTVEFWVYLATGDTGSARGLVAKGTSNTGWLVSLDSSQKVVFTYTSSTITSSGAINLDAWNHIAVVREGTGSNQTKIYINGTNDGTGTVSTDFNQTSVMYVGCNRTAGDPMKGFIDDVRVTKGIARYTTTFTPPTAPFEDL